MLVPRHRIKIFPGLLASHDHRLVRRFELPSSVSRSEGPTPISNPSKLAPLDIRGRHVECFRLFPNRYLYPGNPTVPDLPFISGRLDPRPPTVVL